jgi:hypothetical protein
VGVVLESALKDWWFMTHKPRFILGVRYVLQNRSESMLSTLLRLTSRTLIRLAHMTLTMEVVGITDSRTSMVIRSPVYQYQESRVTVFSRSPLLQSGCKRSDSRTNPVSPVSPRQ